MERETLRNRIFSIRQPHEFNELAVELFHYQYEQNSVYRTYVNSIGIDHNTINAPADIPFLPVSFFKTHQVISGDFHSECVFESSRTTGTIPSRHFIASVKLYEESFSSGFEYFYGPVSDYHIFALLPSYVERGNSSLVYMVEKLRWRSNLQFGGFYLNETSLLIQHLQEALSTGRKVILFGVTFALLDLINEIPRYLENLIIVETGGMKGRRKEITRMELHEILIKGFGVKFIHSEYGMTELLSQAWSAGEGIYRCPPWMRIVIRDMNDPLSLEDRGNTGGINVVDLANIDSCCFISTQDLGRVFQDGSFEVIGRFDSSDVRGCSLLVS